MDYKELRALNSRVIVPRGPARKSSALCLRRPSARAGRVPQPVPGGGFRALGLGFEGSGFKVSGYMVYPTVDGGNPALHFRPHNLRIPVSQGCT